MTILVSPCVTCRWYEGDFHCKAFKEKVIPKEIITARNDHREPYEGDNGIRYEPVERK